MLSLLKKYKSEIDKCDLLIIELRQEIENLKKEKQTARATCLCTQKT